MESKFNGVMVTPEVPEESSKYEVFLPGDGERDAEREKISQEILFYSNLYRSAETTKEAKAALVAACLLQVNLAIDNAISNQRTFGLRRDYGEPIYFENLEQVERHISSIKSLEKREIPDGCHRWDINGFRWDEENFDFDQPHPSTKS